MNPFESSSHELPPELQESLRRFQRRWRWLNSMTLLGMLLCIPLSSFLLLALSDRLWATPGWLRLLLALPVPLLLFAALYPWAKRWLIDRPTARGLAQFMGRLDPSVGDRLLGAVELSEGSEESWMGSPALRRAAIAQVAREMKGRKPEERFDTVSMKKLMAGAVALSAVVLLFLALAPDALINSFARWLQPHNRIERYTFVRLYDFPETLHVAHGEEFSFAGRVEHVHGNPVREVSHRLDGTEEIEVQVEAEQGLVTVEAEGMREARQVQLRAGDATEQVRIQPMLRPELQSLGAELEWPAYLNKEPEQLTLRRRRLEVPLGSTVSLNGTVSRELKQAMLASGEQASLDGARFLLPPQLVETNLSFTVNWEDEVGLRPRNPATVEVIAKADQAPRVALNGLAPAVAVLPDQFLEIDLSARDDYGLDRVWARWRVLQDGVPRDQERDLELQGTAGSQTISFSPERLGFVAGDSIELTAFALDAFPGREPSRSSRHRIVVISKEQHAKMLLDQMEQVLAQLDDLIREEAQATEENKQTEARSDEDLLDPSTAEDLMDRALDEVERAEQVMDTAGKMEDLIGEAAANDQISDELIADWAEIAGDLKDRAVPAMEAAADKLRKASEAVANAAEASDGGAAGNEGEGSASESGNEGEAGDQADAGDSPEEGDASDPGEQADAGDSSEDGDVAEPGERADAGDSSEEGDASDPGEQADAGEPAEPGDAAEPSASTKASMGSPSSGSSGSPGSSGASAQPSEAAEEVSDIMTAAVEDQEEALEAMRRGEEGLNESIEQSLSESFINRFKELARKQAEVGQLMQKLMPLTIAKTVEQLPEDLAKHIRDNAERQAEISRETRYVYDDLEGFYRRSQQEILQEVRSEMSEENFASRLPKMQELILQNIIGRTSQEAKAWSENFLAWAHKLSGDAGGGGGSGGEGAGGGGGDEEGESLETMIALLRAREQQENLRRHTRNLDESYADNLQYDRDSAELARRQNDLAIQLQPLEQRVQKLETKQLVSLASGEMMNAGVKLNASETDQGTIGIQTEVIELLASALDQSMNTPSQQEESSSSSSSQQPSASRAAMMRQIMQMMQASSGSGSGQGAPGSQGGEGSTGFGDPGDQDIRGRGRADSLEALRGSKGSGAVPEFWPSRYRKLMDGYFNAMEGE